MVMTQSAGSTASMPVAAAAILIAAASNNLMKGVYAFTLSGHKTGVRSLALLVGLAIVGLVPLLWFAVASRNPPGALLERLELDAPELDLVVLGFETDVALP